MANSVAISPGLLLLLLIVQNISTQQLVNNNAGFNTAGAVQQKAAFTQQMVQDSGYNFNVDQQANMQQTNSQQSNNQQFLNQFSNGQLPVNSNPQLLQKQNQNLATNIFSALHNIRQSPQNQGTNIGQAVPIQQANVCGTQLNSEQRICSQSQNPLNQPISSFSISGMNKPQTSNQLPLNTFMESQQIQPMFPYQIVPDNNVPTQQLQQNIYPLSPLNSFTNNQDQGYIKTQPISKNVASEHAKSLQSPIVMVPAAQTNGNPDQPIVLTLQATHTSLGQGQPSGQNQPIIYTVQTQPFSTLNQNQQIGSNQPRGTNSAAMDDQSLMSNVLAQIRNTQGNNPLASILPALLSSKSEKSSSMKVLLPLIINMLNERRSGCNGCTCPHCGCSNYNNQNIQEPVINSGYSNQKNYSQQEVNEEMLSKVLNDVDTNLKPTSSVADSKHKDNEINDNNSEASDEEEEEEESEEEEDDE